jgi:hypothetical protein
MILFVNFVSLWFIFKSFVFVVIPRSTITEGTTFSIWLTTKARRLIDVNHEGATDTKTLQKMALFVNVVSLWFTFVNVVSLWFLVVLRVVSFVV